MRTDRSIPDPNTFQACWIEPGHPRRPEAERFVADTYRLRYAARLHAFMPHLIAFSDADGRIHAVVGLRLAGHGPLFLERYLDEPVEAAIQRRSGQPIERHALIEIGNFAATQSGAARAVIVRLIPLLRSSGLRWVALVATRQLRNALFRLGLSPQSLGPAQAARLGEEAEEWGCYYEAQPELVYGDLRSAHCAESPQQAVRPPGYAMLAAAL